MGIRIYFDLCPEAGQKGSTTSPPFRAECSLTTNEDSLFLAAAKVLSWRQALSVERTLPRKMRRTYEHAKWPDGSSEVWADLIIWKYRLSLSWRRLARSTRRTKNSRANWEFRSS